MERSVRDPRRTPVWAAVGACLVVVCILAGLATQARGARLLVVDSYHRGYPWSDGIREGLREALGLHLVAEDSLATASGDLTARVIFLDTKRNPDPEWSRARAVQALMALEAWRPDVVLACDDNAVRDLVVPHLLGRSLPVVYCGVNWDAGVYGLPAANVIGMIEVEQVQDLVSILRPHAAGDRIGLLLLDTTSGRRDLAAYDDHLDLKPLVRLVPDYAAWRREFVAMQDRVDMLLIKQNITGDVDFDLAGAVAFTAEHTRIPTGTTAEAVMQCALVSLIKNPREQGRWAAGAIEQVLAGTPPAALPAAVYRESRLLLTLDLARRLGVVFPMSLIERATFVEEVWQP